MDVPLLPSRPKIKTQIDDFGLFRLYNEDSLPTNDPNMDNWLDEAGLSALQQRNSNRLNEKATNPFYPYLMSRTKHVWYCGHGES